MSETKGSALSRYMGGRFDPINKPLRGEIESKSGIELGQEMLGQLRLRDRVAPGTILYRHIGGRNILKADNKEYGKKKGEKFRTGGECRDKAFMSCSKREEYITKAIAESSNKQHVFIITTSKNSKAHDVSDLRGNTEEAEVIYEPNTKFIITSKGNRKFGKKTARVWYLTEQDEGLHRGSSKDEITVADLD